MIIVFYHSPEHSHKDHQAVIASDGSRAGFIRAEISSETFLEDALAEAKPGNGDMVLNSVEME